jgi:hypothetical protein
VVEMTTPNLLELFHGASVGSRSEKDKLKNMILE